MTDRPIIFSGPMIRALYAGRKTQTRRLSTSPLRRCAVGDRLYVREAISCGGIFSDVVEVRYRAHERASHTEFVDQVPVALATSALPAWPKYRPSIHMPRWASRMTLVVEAVRVEPLLRVIDADALAEGVLAIAPPSKDGMRHFGVEGTRIDRPTPAHAFADLWSSLHQADGECWEDNPEVVALTFRVERGNIDRIAA
jgi:hypothetical protein